MSHRRRKGTQKSTSPTGGDRQAKYHGGRNASDLLNRQERLVSDLMQQQQRLKTFLHGDYEPDSSTKNTDIASDTLQLPRAARDCRYQEALTRQVQHDLQRCKSDLNRKDSQLIENSNEIEKLRGELSDAQRATSRAQESLESLKEDLKEALGDRDTTLKQLSALKGDLAAEKEQNASLAQKLTQLSSTLDDSRTRAANEQENFEKRLKVLQSRNSSLIEKVAELESRKRVTDEASESLSEDVRDLRKQLRNAQSEGHVKDAKVRNFKAELKAKNETIGVYEAKLGKSVTEQGRLESELEVLRAVKTVSKEKHEAQAKQLLSLGQLNEKLKDRKEELVKKLWQSSRKITETEKRSHALVEEVSSLKVQLRDLAQAKESSDAKNKSLSREVNALNSAKESLVAQTQQLQNQVTSLEGALKRKSEDMNDRKSSIANLQAQHAAYKSLLREKLKEQSQRAASLKAENEKLKDSESQLRTEAAALSNSSAAQLQSLQDKLDEHDSKVISQKLELRELREKVVDLTDKASGVSKLQEQNVQLQSEISSVTVEKSQLKKELVTLRDCKGKNEDLLKQINALKKDVACMEDLKSETAKLKSQVKSLSAEKDLLDKKLQEARDCDLKSQLQKEDNRALQRQINELKKTVAELSKPEVSHHKNSIASRAEHTQLYSMKAKGNTLFNSSSNPKNPNRTNSSAQLYGQSKCITSDLSVSDEEVSSNVSDQSPSHAVLKNRPQHNELPKPSLDSTLAVDGILSNFQSSNDVCRDSRIISSGAQASFKVKPPSPKVKPPPPLVRSYSRVVREGAHSIRSRLDDASQEMRAIYKGIEKVLDMDSSSCRTSSVSSPGSSESSNAVSFREGSLQSLKQEQDRAKRLLNSYETFQQKIAREKRSTAGSVRLRGGTPRIKTPPEGKAREKRLYLGTNRGGSSPEQRLDMGGPHVGAHRDRRSSGVAPRDRDVSRREATPRDEIARGVTVRADPNSRNNGERSLGRTPREDAPAQSSKSTIGLLYAARKGNLSLLEKYLNREDCDVNYAQQPNRLTALTVAVSRGYTDVVRRLLQQPNIDVDAMDSFGRTARSIALAHRRNLIANMLSQHTRGRSRARQQRDRIKNLMQRSK